MTERQIQACFAEVKEKYFHRWDRKGRWRVTIAESRLCRDNTGYCDSRSRTIFLDRQVCGMTNAGIRVFLIHEICHDVAAAGHNRLWALRMEKAATLAEKSGDSEIAKIIRCDISSYCPAGVLEQYSLAQICDLGEELVDDNPSIGIDDLIRRIAHHFGHSPRKVRREFGSILRELCTVD
ncbi:MAG: hypothetical protein IID41_01560 [Planctomycetes bacterium]|nr:hypothetical protein [Planctomycetota bacterium]